MLCLIIAGAMILDLILGDPRWYPHPVRFIGWLCATGERCARNLTGRISLKTWGVLCGLVVILVSVGCAFLILVISFYLSPFVGILSAVFLLYASISTGDLIAHSRSVRQALDAQDIAGARVRIGMMVGRDTKDLDEESIVRACIESVSENLVDGTTAVLFWAFAAGLLSLPFEVSVALAAPLGAVFYKAVNTLDSMFGYRNERYVEFGWFGARLDDWLNFIPARISGLCVVMSAFFMNYDAGCAMRTFKQDRLKSPSPNSAHTEAAVSGALRVRLGGVSSYSGKVAEKPVLGASLNGAQLSDITRANRLIVMSSLVFFVLCCITYLLLSRL